MKRSMLLMSFLITASLFIASSIEAMKSNKGSNKGSATGSATGSVKARGRKSAVPTAALTMTVTPGADLVTAAATVQKTVAAGDKAKACKFAKMATFLTNVMTCGKAKALEVKGYTFDVAKAYTYDQFMALSCSHQAVVTASMVATVVAGCFYGYIPCETVTELFNKSSEWTQWAFTTAWTLVSTQETWTNLGASFLSNGQFAFSTAQDFVNSSLTFAYNAGTSVLSVAGCKAVWSLSRFLDRSQVVIKCSDEAVAA